MSHFVLQTSQVSLKSNAPSPQLCPCISQHPALPVRCKVPSRRSNYHNCKNHYRLVVKNSSCSPVIDGGGEAKTALERCFRAPDAQEGSGSDLDLGSQKIGPVMKKKASSLGPITLQKGKLVQKKKLASPPELELGGGGGDIGKIIRNGGGDGGDDGGGDDDDDYFDDFDDGDDGDEGGLFRRRMFFEELFDRKFVDAVLNEWQKTVADLPFGLKQAYEMGLLSSAQMVRFLAINARPTTARFISRSVPDIISREFIGRMIADPSFLYKLLLEQAATIGCSVWWELKARKDRIKKEWNLALVNVLTVTACNAFVVWTLAPCRSYGNTFRIDLQNSSLKRPNNIFERSYPLREFNMQNRILSFFYKAAELCAVGITAGVAQSSLKSFLAGKKEDRLSLTIPTVITHACGYGAFLGFYANFRYQLLSAFDIAAVNHFDVIGVALALSSALRILNAQVGESSRVAWLGLEADPLVESDNLVKAYNRSSGGAAFSSSKWFISKKPMVSGLALLGESVDGEAPAPKARRKRIVRKKVPASSA